jgi:hypothetical protein
VSRLPDLDYFLDPKSLTPQQLYTLQSETWAQGAEAEQERIISLIEEYGSEDFTSDLIALIKGEQK